MCKSTHKKQNNATLLHLVLTIFAVMDQVDKILRDYKLKKTKLRHAVLSLFLKTPTSLSHTDLSKALKIPFDRVTLFRTLTSFEEAGILHKIIDLNGTAQYALSTANNGEEESHAHFICLKCQEIFCLDDIFPMDDIAVPKGFEKLFLDVKIKGYCDQCVKTKIKNQNSAHFKT